MSITNESFKDKLHRLRVQLYENPMPQFEGKYHGRTIHEDSLSIEDLCKLMVTRGGFTGKYSVLLECVTAFFREVAYNLCDGYSINLGLFSFYPDLGGLFDSDKEPFDPKKHKLRIRYRTNAELRRLLQTILVEIIGLYNANAYILDFINHDENSTNRLYTAGALFTLTGSKLKIEGDDACGMFIYEEDGSGLKPVKVTRIAHADSGMIVGNAPVISFSRCSVVVRTCYSGKKGVPLKEPRIIKSGFILDNV